MTENLSDMLTTGNSFHASSMSRKHTLLFHGATCIAGDIETIHHGQLNSVPTSMWPGDLSFITISGTKAFHVDIKVLVYNLTTPGIVSSYVYCTLTGVVKADGSFEVFESFKHDGLPLMETVEILFGGTDLLRMMTVISVVNDDETDPCDYNLIAWFKQVT